MKRVRVKTPTRKPRDAAIEACYRNEGFLAIALIRAGWPSEQQHKFCLDEAAYWNCIETCEDLLQEGLSTETTKKYHHTALHWCASKGHSHILKLLLRYGAPINPNNFRLCTPLDYAVDRGRLECAEILLEHGAHLGNDNLEKYTRLLNGEDDGDSDDDLDMIELVGRYIKA